MEKLRRDRINSSLNEMKILVLESLNKDVSKLKENVQKVNQKFKLFSFSGKSMADM